MTPTEQKAFDALFKALVRLKIEVVLSDIPLDYVESHFREHLEIAEQAILGAEEFSNHQSNRVELKKLIHEEVKQCSM